MPSSTQNFASTLGVDKKCLLGKYSMFYKIVIPLNMWFKRYELCKSMKKKKYRHLKVQEIGRHEGPKVLEKDEHMKALGKKKMIAMSQNIKLERDHSYKRSIV
jgi:hypothetical protein